MQQKTINTKKLKAKCNQQIIELLEIKGLEFLPE